MVIATSVRANAKTSAVTVEGAYTTVSESVSVSFVVTVTILSDGKNCLMKMFSQWVINGYNG